MRPQPAPVLSPQQIAAFDRDGCLLLRRVIDPARLAALQAELEREVASILDRLVADGAIPTSGADLPFSRRLCLAGAHADRLGRSWTDRIVSPAVHAVQGDPGLLAAIGAVLPGTLCGHRQFNARPKLPGQELTVVPWHQDSGYYGRGTAGDRILTAWLPLVPVDAGNGCMEVALGSHRQGWVEHVPAEDAGGFLKAVADPDPATVATMAMQPGDALLMHNLVLHRSTPNRSEGIRWSIDLRYYAAETPGAADLRWGFPKPWVLDGPDAVPVETWMGWYRERR